MSGGDFQVDKDRAAAYWQRIRRFAVEDVTRENLRPEDIVARLHITLAALTQSANNPSTTPADVTEAAMMVMPWARAALKLLEEST